jgi:anhydro-N-acetylmuramic acid kinase
VSQILRRRFFRAKPPKTAGREEFGQEFVAEFLAMCPRARKADIIATATALTARSIADAVQQFACSKIATLPPRSIETVARKSKSPPSFAENAKEEWGNPKSFSEMILSGGGARNVTLVRMLAEQLSPLGITVRFSDEFGLPSEAKEAVAFGVLAYETWNRRASNVPSATGAARPAVLGKISYA